MTIIIPNAFLAISARASKRFGLRICHRAFTRQNHQTHTNREVPVVPTNSARRTEQLDERNQIMTITRGVAASAMLASLALVVTAPVSTADPLNGHYIETETYPDGHQVHSDWFITPCGAGWASINFHYTWDPNTLDGNVQITNNVQACGNPPGYSETNKLHLQLAP